MVTYKEASKQFARKAAADRRARNMTKSTGNKVNARGKVKKPSSTRKQKTLANKTAAVDSSMIQDDTQASEETNATATISLDFLRRLGMSSMEKRPISFLHIIPGELRNNIYRYVGYQRQPFDLSSREEPALLKAIPDLRPEFHSIIFAENKLEVDVYSNFVVHGIVACPNRIPFRGGKHGVGCLAIPPNSWIRQANPRAIKVMHIIMHVLERGGYSICDVHIIVNKDTKVPRMLAKPKVEARRRFKPDIATARVLVKGFGQAEGFNGFSLEQLDEIARCFGRVE